MDISGLIGEGDQQVYFSNVSDVIGGAPINGMNVRDYLQMRYPGKLILEMPGLNVDLGIQPVRLLVPVDVPCPTGTHQIW
jgi:hypothetical protein